MSSVRIATFRKVNFEQFYKDYEETFRYGQNVLKIKEIYGADVNKIEEVYEL